uniref:Uncharacterized protein n=1 Tax=Chromera velia CCMP2878 TaxID=1169474 RepID=A0A0G4G9L3_9ALVE|eukprot:Cvel_20866.t1-p1 / transcript=Cvel_20866.t1 / gene=Cvel_20866 / organism=Chromera_velia_CCMP2878 / gene_product=hypothetical protein / transcript_product=hypothetical protein / location=Cvel_scaffold1912:19246-21526(-) / protein_length=101 / sequence_SO=supercontig / SO=protein_coding / is_pseudo=false
MRQDVLKQEQQETDETMDPQGDIRKNGGGAASAPAAAAAAASTTGGSRGGWKKREREEGHFRQKSRFTFPPSPSESSRLAESHRRLIKIFMSFLRWPVFFL